MSEYQRCGKCNHPQILAMGVDCPICFQHQRSKMQSADNAYLRTVAYETINSRRAPTHMYRSGTEAVADTATYQHTESLLAAENGMPLLRKSELTSRIAANRALSAQRVRPLQKAGAISLRPLERFVPPTKPSASEDDDVFFDDAPYRPSKYVYLNGDVFQCAQRLQQDRVMYGIDSPAAAVETAVKEAAKGALSAKVSSESDDSRKGARAPSTDRDKTALAQPVVETSGYEAGGDALAGSIREFFSASGRCYRVVEVRNALPPIITHKENGPLRSSVVKERRSVGSEDEVGSRSPRSFSAHSHLSEHRPTSNQDEGGDARAKAPRKPPKHQERRRHGAGSRRQERDDTDSGASAHRSVNSRTASATSQQRKASNRLPPIGVSNSQRVPSEHGADRRRSEERTRRHVDSMSSEEMLSAYLAQSTEAALPGDTQTSPTRTVSDCVVMDNSDRPADRLRRGHEDGAHHTVQRKSVDTSPLRPGGSAVEGTRLEKQRRHRHDPEGSVDSPASMASGGDFMSDLLSGSLSDSVRTSSTSSPLSNADGRADARRRGHSTRHSPERPKKSSRRAGKQGKPRARRSTPSLESGSSRSGPAQTRTPSRRQTHDPEQVQEERATPPQQLPEVRAVKPINVTSVVADAMTPSVRYSAECPSPVTHSPPTDTPSFTPPTSTVRGAGVAEATAAAAAVPAPERVLQESAGPAARQPHSGGAGAGALSSAPSDPLRPWAEEKAEEVLEKLRVLHGSEAPHTSPAASVPVGALTPSPHEPDSTREDSNGSRQDNASILYTGGPLTLDAITEHVLRVICERLGGRLGDIYSTAHPSRTQDERIQGEADRAEEERRAAERAEAEQQQRRLRQLVNDVQAELHRYESMAAASSSSFSLSSLSSSLTDALEEVRQQNTGPAGAARGRGDDARERSAAATPLKGGVALLRADATRLERLLGELRRRRQRRAAQLLEACVQEEAEAREQRLRDAEEAYNADVTRAARTLREAWEAVKKKKQEEEERRRQEMAAQRGALEAQEADERAALAAEAVVTCDALAAAAAAAEAEVWRRMLAAQAAAFEEERTDMCEDELDARADVAAMEAAEAEDLWDVAARLWQAAEDEAMEREAAAEAARAKSAAWRSAQAEEAARMQAELKRMEEAAAARGRASLSQGDEEAPKKKMYRLVSKGKMVRSNLIPGQLLDVSEQDGKVRLIGDPHVAAVEARMRERRRMDKLRQERLAAVAGAAQRPPTNKAGRSTSGNAQPSLLQLQPSTVRVNITSGGQRSAVPLAARKRSQATTRSSSQHSVASSRGRSANNSRLGGGGSRSNSNNSGVGGRFSQRGPLHSQSTLVGSDDVDLGVEGQRVGTPAKTRSRANSLASVGVPHMGGIFNAATPHKNNFPDDETDALTSLSTVNVDY